MTPERPNYAREIRFALTDAVEVCDKLGLLQRGRFSRQSGGVIICCPWHEERTPSCSVRRGPDGTIAVRCHACGATGDALSLVAQARGLNPRSDFRSVLRDAAELASMWRVVQELDTGRALPDRPPAPPPPPPEPERDYPELEQVMAVWAASMLVTDVPEVAAHLTARKLDPELVADLGLARAIPDGALLPRWAAYKRVSWLKTGHRLIVPMRDALGAIRSVRAWRVVDGDSPKRLPPGGHKATGLVMACPIGVAMLEGAVQPRRVVVTEGEPDWLTWSIRAGAGPVTACIGIVTGSWSQSFADRVPTGAEVVIRTDHDPAGDAYAHQIFKTLRTKCFVRRGG